MEIMRMNLNEHLNEDLNDEMIRVPVPHYLPILTLNLVMITLGNRVNHSVLPCCGSHPLSVTEQLLRSPGS